MRRLHLLSLSSVIPVVIGALAAPSVAAPTDQLSLGFARVTVGALVSPGLTNDGTVATTQRVVSSGGGVVAAAAALTGDALQLPAFSTARTAPRAVVAVTSTAAVDALAPGDAAFGFGVDARLDARNRGSSQDNGNNAVQRGLFGSGAQYKLEVEAGQAMCRVEGSLGAVVVGIPVAVETWYRLACAATAGPVRTVTLTVTPLAPDGSLGAATTMSAAGSVGTLTYVRSVPFSIGGKLTATGALVGSSDQFNGRLDEVWYRVG